MLLLDAFVEGRARAGARVRARMETNAGGRGSRRASWGKDLLRRWLARRLALPIFSHLPSFFTLNLLAFPAQLGHECTIVGKVVFSATIGGVGRLIINLH